MCYHRQEDGGGGLCVCVRVCKEVGGHMVESSLINLEEIKYCFLYLQPVCHCVRKGGICGVP